MPSSKTKIREIRTIHSRAPKEIKPNINDIIRLREEKRIRNFKTAEHVINRLAASTSNKQRIARAQTEDENAVAKYGNLAPMTGRLSNKKKGTEKTHSLTMILFRNKEMGEKTEKTPTENVSPVAQEIEDNKPVSKLLKKQKGVADLAQLFIGTFDVRLDAFDYNYLQSVEEMLLRRGEGPRGGHKRGTLKENT
jgi:hypothetical protein